MKVNNTINYQNSNTNPSFAGTVNMEKLRELMKKVEPEAIRKITKGNMEDFARKWVDIPNPKLDAWFCCHDLNLALKRNNIEALLEKRGFSINDDYFYDVANSVTDGNYDLAVLLAKEPSMGLIEMMDLLRQVKEGSMRLEDAFTQFKRTHNGNRGYRSFEDFVEDTANCAGESQSTKRDGSWTKEQFISHIQDRLAKGKFKKSDLKDSEVRNLAKLFGTTEEQVRNMDKQEYRRLAIKFHPDSSEKGNDDIFSILNSLFHCK